MALKMAQPWKDPKTGVYHLRQRTPRDLLHRKGSTVTLPVGDGFASVKVGDTVQASLRTRDPREAKSLHSAADAALKRVWNGLRDGPVKLSHKQVVALSGTLFRDLTRALDEDPGPPELWEAAKAEDQAALKGGLSLAITEEARREHSLELRFGRWADLLLSREGLTVDQDTRTRLVRAVAEAMVDATDGVHRMAIGDYSPDPTGLRFPAWQRPAEKPSPERADIISLATLFERWSAYQADKRAAATIQRYGASLRSLAAFTTGRDVRSLTSDDLHAWAEHRRDNEGVSARAINKNDLVAASSVLSWAAKRQGGKLLETNPVTGVRLDEPKRVAVRERTFRAEEITAILTAASAVQVDPENPSFGHARHWCPWLAAYSGARIAELTGLEVEDIRHEAGVPVMDLKRTKTGLPRAVPLHPHLVELGFLRFVADVGSGPLFYDKRRHKANTKSLPADLRAQKVGKWVREAAKLDPAVDPNHGWRHTWKTRALGAGIEERIRDAITGHRVGSVARQYESPPVALLATAMARYPRYEL